MVVVRLGAAHGVVGAGARCRRRWWRRRSGMYGMACRFQPWKIAVVVVVVLASLVLFAS